MSNHVDRARVIDEPDKNRFEIHVDGELAGWAEYRLRPGRIAFTHTETDERFQGRGLASQLARAALDSARERGLQVTPLCPYIANYIRKHPEYVAIVDDHHRASVSSAESE